MNQYIASTLILLLLDISWLSIYMSEKYTNMIPRIQGASMKVNLYYAVISYILMVIGLNIFVVPNIRKTHRLSDSMKYGFIFGMVVYGVYDFTAAAVLKDWDLKLALQDVIWGGFVYFIASYLGSFF